MSSAGAVAQAFPPILQRLLQAIAVPLTRVAPVSIDRDQRDLPAFAGELVTLHAMNRSDNRYIGDGKRAAAAFERARSSRSP